MNITDIFRVIESYDFAKKYNQYQQENNLHSNLKNQCIGHEMTKYKKIGLLTNPQKGYWKITKEGKELFTNVKENDVEDFYRKYIFI